MCQLELKPECINDKHADNNKKKNHPHLHNNNNISMKIMFVC
jgi:hypothetical protein